MKKVLLIAFAILLVAAGCTYQQLGRSSSPGSYQISYPDTTLASIGNGKITGTVMNINGEGVFGANILVVETGQGASVIDFEGKYYVLGMKPGSYTLRVSSVVYGTVMVKNLVVYPGLTTTVDFKLSEEALMGEEVYVGAPH